MGDTAVATMGTDALSVDLSTFDRGASQSLKARYAQKKQDALNSGYVQDRQRIVQAFAPANIEPLLTQAIEEGESSFFIDIGEGQERSNFWNPKGAISKQVLAELNQSLRSSTVLTKVDYAYNRNAKKAIVHGVMMMGFMTIMPALVTNLFLSVGATGPAIVLGGLSVIGAVPAWKGTKTLGLRAYPTDNGRYYNDSTLKVSFNNPNKPWVGIPGKAITALSVAAVGVKNALSKLNPYKPSVEQAAALKSEFADSFRGATQNVIRAAEFLSEHANDNGFEFSARVDDLMKFANRQIELIENRSYDRATLSEKRTLLPLVDLFDALETAGKMVTIEQDALSELATRFDAVVSGIETNVRKEESKQSMAALSNIDVGLQRLSR